MGMDLVELVMDFEDEFNLSIPDEDYEHLRTVGDMYEYVIRKKGDAIEEPSRPRVCLTMVTFSRLRPALQAVTDVPRRSIRTMTSMKQLTPHLRRRSDWENIKEMSGLQLPDLQRPTWLKHTLTASVFGAVTLVVYCLSGIMPLAFALAFGLIILAPLLAKALVNASQPFATLIPANCATVGGLSRCVEKLNHGVLQERYHGWNSGDVWRTLRGLVSEQLGVPLEEVTYGARFVEDLNAD